MSNPAASFAPMSVATGQPVQLAMQRLLLTGKVLPVGARLIAQHVFQSAEANPLEVIYSFSLPRDAALRRFRVTGEGFEVESELKETEAAVKAYEEALAQGSLATLARQYGDGVVNLTVGNIRPHETVTVWLEILAGVELKDDGLRFRFPFTLAPRYHAGAKAAEVAPGEGEMELPPAEFGDVILPRFRKDASALHQIGFDLALTSALEFDEIGSPSHPVRIKHDNARTAHIALATGKDVPNRDLVLDGRFKSTEPQVLAGRDKNGTGRFAAVLPSSAFSASQETPRRVVILVDRSGSMGGEPISQARKAIEACLGALSENDSFGLIAFDNVPEMFHPTLQMASREVRDEARKFLKQIDARGGTELAAGVQAAAGLLQGGAGDILILTDGQVAGTEKILDIARSTGVRLHCLGIGSASQDRFLTLLARETGGVSRFVTPQERVGLATVDLFASIGHPLASGLKAGSNIQPQPASSVFRGTPVLLFGEGDGPLELTWEGGRLTRDVAFNDDAIAETVWLLQGSRLITDWESRYPSVEALAPLDKRQQSRVAMRLLDLSRTYGLASREMSLVAVVKRAGDRPGELPVTRVVPVGMAANTNFDAYFPDVLLNAAMPLSSAAPLLASRAAFLECAMPAQQAPLAERPRGILHRLMHRQRPQSHTEAARPEEALMELASHIESDGGMPGDDPSARACATLVALFAFVSQGHTPTSGAFRSHVARLIDYLKTVKGINVRQRELVAKAITDAEKGHAPAGDWLKLSQDAGDHWEEILNIFEAFS